MALRALTPPVIPMTDVHSRPPSLLESLSTMTTTLKWFAALFGYAVVTFIAAGFLVEALPEYSFAVLVGWCLSLWLAGRHARFRAATESSR